MTATLTPALADRFARIALGHVAREYPHKLDHVLNGPDDARTPGQLHPVFHGSFDWHSCVHGYWMLLRLLRRFPEMSAAADIEELAERMLTADRLAKQEAVALDVPARCLPADPARIVLDTYTGLFRTDAGGWSHDRLVVSGRHRLK